MHHTQADLEAALQEIMHAEDRLREQRGRLEQLRCHGQSTEQAEDLLRALQQSRDILQQHLARLTAPARPGNLVTSRADDSEDDWDS